MLGPAETFDVGRRGESTLALVARNWNGNHVLIDDFTQSHARVVAFVEDVEFLVRDRHVDPDAGKGFRKTRQKRPGDELLGDG